MPPEPTKAQTEVPPRDRPEFCNTIEGKADFAAAHSDF